MKNFIKTTLTILILASTLSTANAKSITDGCNAGRECAVLGAAYFKGTGVKQDYVKAVEFFQKACDLDEGSGCTNLGIAYEYGKGVRKSINKALKYYGKACDLKFALGCEYYAKLKQQ